MSKLKYNSKAYSALAAFLDGGRLPHAILLEGVKGSGRTTFAYEIALGALCTGSPSPCYICKDCAKVEKRIHPDIIEFGGDGGNRSFHVDKVRELRQEAYIRPNEGRFKILILKDVHTMSVQAENALLKIIEEPPPGVIFILTCENKAALLETILSRVTVIQLQTPTHEQCAEVLKELVPGRSEEDYRAAAIAGVSVGGAIALLAQEDTSLANNEGMALLEALCFGSELEVLGTLSRYEKDVPAFAQLLEFMAGGVRRLLSPSDQNSPSSRLKERLSPLQLMRILAIIEEIGEAVPQNVNRLLLVTNLSARIKMVIAR